ncbi:MAG: hypothetical protein V3S44_01670 [Alphaproteobacteria bacterium]
MKTRLGSRKLHRLLLVFAFVAMTASAASPASHAQSVKLDAEVSNLETSLADFQRNLGEQLREHAKMKRILEQLKNSCSGDGDSGSKLMELQEVFQRQQKMLQMMSNIAKMQRDTVKAIIRKIG